MKNRSEHADRGWNAGWKAHELAQLRRLAALPLSEKLQWLEEAHDVVRSLTRATLRSGKPGSTKA